MSHVYLQLNENELNESRTQCFTSISQADSTNLVFMYVCMRVFMCVCMRETKKDRERENVFVCVCVCVCVCAVCVCTFL